MMMNPYTAPALQDGPLAQQDNNESDKEGGQEDDNDNEERGKRMMTRNHYLHSKTALSPSITWLGTTISTIRTPPTLAKKMRFFNFFI